MKATTASKAVDLMSNVTPTSAEPSSTAGTLGVPSSRYRRLTSRVANNIAGTAASARPFKTLGRALGDVGLVGALSGRFVQILYWTED